MGFSPRYPPVAGRLHTRYAPVRRSPPGYCYPALPLDLHVLSLPLAFILSQDQTLHCKNCFFYLWLVSCLTARPRRTGAVTHAISSSKSFSRYSRSRLASGLSLSSAPLGRKRVQRYNLFLFCKIFFLIISRNKILTSEKHIVTYQLFFDKIKNRPQTGQKNIQKTLYFLKNWALTTQQKIQYSCNKLNINEIIYIQTTWYIKQNKQNQGITKCTNINPNRALGFHT